MGGREFFPSTLCRCPRLLTTGFLNLLAWVFPVKFFFLGVFAAVSVI